MGHYARVNAQNIVIEVIVADQEFIDSGAVGDPAEWLKTSYNTRGGIYYLPNSWEPDPDQSKAFRKNYAGVEFTYDPALDAFIPPKPYASWVLDEQTCLWQSPVPYPTDGRRYEWDEETKQWIYTP